VSGGSPGRARVAHAGRPGLWSVEGSGVLAREEDLVLLANLTDSSLVDRLLELLAESAESGTDGLAFARAVEDVLDADRTWRAGPEDGESPAVVALGPGEAGLAVTVTGGASAEITTVNGTQQQLAPGSSMLLRCLVGTPVLVVHATLGSAQERARTDRFSRLDAGVVRAGGFSYRIAGPSAPALAAPGAARAYRGAEPPAVAEPSADEPGSAATPAASDATSMVSELAEVAGGPGSTAAVPAPAASGNAAPSAAAGPADEGTVLPGDVPPGEAPQPSDGAEGAQSVSSGEAPQPFESVLLVGEQVTGESRGRRPPLPPGVGRRRPTDAASAPVEILGCYCKNGHFDDPEARFCAVCGISMNQKTLVPRPGVRPPLGLLVVDGGAIFQLDADYVIGREPGLDATVTAGKARPLRIMDNTDTVSRAHAKIELDGWEVLVSDLGSANGTVVRQPGDSTGQRLVPRLPIRLVPGSYVDLGGTGFHYESHRGR